MVQGQRVMQAARDIFLGWLGAPGQPAFYVRQMRDWKVGVDVTRLDPGGFALYARACGWTLARAHARSGEPAVIAGYLGDSDTFDGAIADFGEADADQNEADFGELKRAIADGRVTATPGV